MAQRIASLLEANRSLIANVSHELRTPLARIRVALELAGESPVQAQEMLAGVSGDLAELERLIEDIFTMIRLAAPGGLPPLRRERCQGLTAEEVAHAFTPFWRSDASRSRNTGGVGLGLALARRIARAHGGDVALESQPGHGTRAILSVPPAP